MHSLHGLRDQSQALLNNITQSVNQFNNIKIPEIKYVQPIVSKEIKIDIIEEELDKAKEKSRNIYNVIIDTIKDFGLQVMQYVAKPFVKDIKRIDTQRAITEIQTVKRIIEEVEEEQQSNVWDNVSLCNNETRMERISDNLLPLYIIQDNTRNRALAMIRATHPILSGDQVDDLAELLPRLRGHTAATVERTLRQQMAIWDAEVCGDDVPFALYHNWMQSIATDTYGAAARPTGSISDTLSSIVTEYNCRRGKQRLEQMRMEQQQQREQRHRSR